MRQDVCSIRRIPPDHVTVLLRELTKITEHKIRTTTTERYFVPCLARTPKLLVERRDWKHNLVTFFSVQERFNDFDNAWVQRYIVSHANLVLICRYVQCGLSRSEFQCLFKLPSCNSADRCIWVLACKSPKYD